MVSFQRIRREALRIVTLMCSFIRSVFLRRLHVNRDDTLLDGLEEYLQMVVGNSYEIRLRHVLFSRLSKVSKGLEDRKFFCSELIAKAYKLMGLIKSDISSSNFFPCDFSSKKDL